MVSKGHIWRNRKYRGRRRRSQAMVKNVATTGYKRLYMNFLWEFLVFLFTLTIVASVYQALEQPEEEGRRIKKQRESDRLVNDFSKEYDIARDDLLKLFNNVKNRRRGEHKGHVSGFTDSFILMLSLFSTIGWGHVYPGTTGGKLLCIFGACVGIPVTFNMICTGARIFIRHIAMLIRVFHDGSLIAKQDKHIEKRINISTRAWLVPTLISCLFGYILLTALVVSAMGDFVYHDSLYYCFVTLLTIGMGDFMKSKSTWEHIDPFKEVAVTLFLMIWTLIGMTILASIIIAAMSSKQNHNKIFQRDLCLRYDKRLVEVINDLEGSDLSDS